MSRGKELTKNTLILSIGKICTQGISFFLLPLYTAKLSTEEYGTVDLLNTYVSLLAPIIIFEIQQAVFRYLIDKRQEEEEKRILISTTFFISIIQSIIFILFFLCIGFFINNNYKYFLAMNVIATIFSSIMLQIARGLGDIKTYTLGSFITASLTIIFNVVGIVVFNLGAYGMLIATFIANILCSIYIIVKLKLYEYIKIKYFNFQRLKEMWKYSVPLIPNSISWWIMGVSDRTIVSTVLGISANGIYSAANKFSSIFTTIYNIFNIAWIESVALHINDKDANTYLSDMINRIFKLFSTLALGIIAIIPFIFKIMVDSSYAEAYLQIPILVISVLCNIMVMLLSALYIAKKMTKVVMHTSIISAIINIITNLLLINYIGLYAASISTFLAYFIMMLIRMKNIKKYVDIKYNYKCLMQILSMTILVVTLYYLQNMFINIISIIIVFAYAVIANRETLILIKNLNLKNIIMKKLK